MQSIKAVEPKNWLRCNHCFCLMSRCKDPFFLIFCGHIFCNKCFTRKVSTNKFVEEDSRKQILNLTTCTVSTVKTVIHQSSQFFHSETKTISVGQINASLPFSLHYETTKQCPYCKAKDVPSMILQEPLMPEIKHYFQSTEKLSENLRQATRFHNMQRILNSKRLNELEKKYALAKYEYHRKSEAVEYLKEKYANLLKIVETLHKHIQELQDKTAQSQKATFRINPVSNVSSIPSSAQSLRHESIHQNGEFRIPNVKKVPRSVAISTKSSNASSSRRGNPFTNYTLQYGRS